ncbi:hypothetical protein HHL24_26765 [Paraburkholderia sp. RP-4-7]|jgi:hypothetical protein|uniref:Uncharacterized protein n=1 Tax=Paraburkholderia polaris TaxID=2728848 RepID=A0A848IQU7_9BURK|nr:VF_A0006 family four-cysteine protein [Paraburkholderia polaris]NMM01527.1 hypothetical protein [Paraburkholderia polaris]
MRRFWIAFALAACASASAWADGFGGQDNDDTFRQCVAQSMRSANNMLAFQIMQNACLKLYRESTMISDSRKSYYICLLQSLQGANNDLYVQMAAKACGDHG